MSRLHKILRQTRGHEGPDYFNISMGGIQKYPELTKALSGLDITATVGLSVLLAYERYHRRI